MAIEATTSHRALTPAEAAELATRTRYRVLGFIILALGIGSFLLFARGLDPNLLSTFRLNTGGVSSAVQLPDLQLPSFSTVTVLSALMLFLGGYQLARGFKGRSTLVLGQIGRASW